MSRSSTREDRAAKHRDNRPIVRANVQFVAWRVDQLIFRRRAMARRPAIQVGTYHVAGAMLNRFRCASRRIPRRDDGLASSAPSVLPTELPDPRSLAESPKMDLYDSS